SFGFMKESPLPAGMEVTAKDWVARPGDTDMDRGGLAGWFVTRLAEMLKLEVPEAPAPPPRLIIRRPSAAQKAAASPAPPSKPLAPATRPEPPHASPPTPQVAPHRPAAGAGGGADGPGDHSRRGRSGARGPARVRAARPRLPLPFVSQRG